MTDVFLFQRDLRLADNTALARLAGSEGVLGMYVFEEELNPKQLQFLVESLEDLQRQMHGKLHCVRDKCVTEVLEDLHHTLGLKRVAFNKGAVANDELVRAWCAANGVEVICEEDATMLPLGSVSTPAGKPFEIFMPFYRRALRKVVPAPQPAPEVNFVSSEGLGIDAPGFVKSDLLEVKGGREEGLKVLEALAKGKFRSYKKQRDFPYKDATTKLGAYLCFGCVSPREVYLAMKASQGKSSVMLQNLYLREFAHNIVHHFPQVLAGSHAMLHGRYERVRWNEDEETYARWCSGQTGLPLVDAAMRCLKATGWMHGQLRKLVATFLIHELGVDWRKGEQWFAAHLVDHDASCNHLGWAWAMSFRRKMNPFKVAGKCDWQCEFIKKWVPELREVPVLDIITWWEARVKWAPDTGYPSMVVEQPGYRVKFKNYIKDYVRPKDPNYKKPTKQSKYGPGKKNVAKYGPKKN